MVTQSTDGRTRCHLFLGTSMALTHDTSNIKGSKGLGIFLMYVFFFFSTVNIPREPVADYEAFKNGLWNLSA